MYLFAYVEMLLLDIKFFLFGKVTVLQSVSDPSKIVCVGNTHLYWHPKGRKHWYWI